MQRLRQRLSIMRREAYVSCRGFDGIPTRVCSAAALRKAGWHRGSEIEMYDSSLTGYSCPVRDFLCGRVPDGRKRFDKEVKDDQRSHYQDREQGRSHF